MAKSQIPHRPKKSAARALEEARPGAVEQARVKKLDDATAERKRLVEDKGIKEDKRFKAYVNGSWRFYTVLRVDTEGNVIAKGTYEKFHPRGIELV